VATTAEENIPVSWRSGDKRIPAEGAEIFGV